MTYFFLFTFLAVRGCCKEWYRKFCWSRWKSNQTRQRSGGCCKGWEGQIEKGQEKGQRWPRRSLFLKIPARIWTFLPNSLIWQTAEKKGKGADKKSVNLQYNTLGRWAKRLGDQASDVPSIIFFHNFLQNSCKNRFNLLFYFFITLQK